MSYDSSSHTSNNDGDQQQSRIGHIVTLFPWSDGTTTTKSSSSSGDDNSSSSSSNNNNVPPSSLFLSLDVASYLAVRDFNTHSSPYVDLPKNCNFTMSVDLRNSQSEPLTAVAALQTELDVHGRDNEDDSNNNNIIAVIGPMQSNQAVMVAELAGIYGYTILSPGSTSRTLEENSHRFPTFGRTCPTHYRNSVALARYVTQTLHVDTLVVVYTQNSFGRSYATDVDLAALHFPLQIIQVTIDEENIQRGIDILKMEKSSSNGNNKNNNNNRRNYYFGAFGGGDYQNILVELYREGLMGDDNSFWIFAEGLAHELHGLEISQDGLKDIIINNNNETTRDIAFYNDLAKAVNGTGSLEFKPPPSALVQMEESWQELRTDTVQWEQYISSHNIATDPDEVIDGFLDVQPKASIYSLFAYDAVMAIGLAACQSDKNVVTGLDIFTSLKGIRFHGASGIVEFQPNTVTRSDNDMSYSLSNILSLPDDDGIVTITNTEAAVITPNEIISLRNFIYADGSSIPPPQHRVVEDMNLTNNIVLGCMYGMAAVSMILPLCAGIWTCRNRNRPCVRESQPIFLGILCVGSFLAASSIIHLTWQEPMSLEVLNFGCKLGPWLFSIGMCLSISALFTKIYRINRVFECAKAFQRAKITPLDVAKPLAFLMVLNCSLLTGLTVVAPLVWVRETTDYDVFGRPTSSFGICRPQEKSLYFLIPLVLVGIGSVLAANYQSYLARNLPSRWNESLYISLSNFILLETLVISLPVLVLVGKEPTAFVFVFSLTIFVAVIAILVPAFLPKILIDSASNNAKVLRLNQAVSAYPNARNPAGLFGGISMRLPKPNRTSIAGPASVKDEDAAVLPPRSKSPEKSVLAESVVSAASLDTQGTSGPALLRNENQPAPAPLEHCTISPTPPADGKIILSLSPDRPERSKAHKGQDKGKGKKNVTFGTPEDNQVNVYEQETKTRPRGTEKFNALNFVDIDNDDSDSSSGEDAEEVKVSPQIKKDSIDLAKAHHKSTRQDHFATQEKGKKMSTLDLANLATEPWSGLC